MDTNDVSQRDDLVSWVQYTQIIAQRNSKQKGQVMHCYPSPTPDDPGFMKRLSKAFSSPHQQGQFAKSILPPAYPPCVRPLGQLQPIALRGMRLETHHRGKKTLVRVSSRTAHMTGILAIVEDEAGTVLLLQLYNQPDESLVPARLTLKHDHAYIIKEPFLRRTVTGLYALRVDHVCDIVELDHEDTQFPAKWKSSSMAVTQTSHDLRMKGNDAVRKQEWANALNLYSLAIEANAATVYERQLAYANRSLANLNLNRPEQALEDARLCTDASSPSEMGLFRQARALYELGNFAQSLSTLEMMLDRHPRNEAAKFQLNRCKARLHEEQTGQYDFQSMYRQAKKRVPLVDCATFSAPVEVRASPGCGLGLFTTVPVVAGQLLVCEKAFAYAFADQDRPSSMSILMDNTGKIVMGAQAHLDRQLVQKLSHSQKALGQYTALHHGNDAAPAVSEVDGQRVVDSFLVHKIQSLNSFGAPRTSREYIHHTLKDLVEGESPPGYSTCGIWLLASRINHDCIGNCQRSFIGDMQIIRATQDLEAGTELRFAYRPPNSWESYQEIQKGLSHWGFTCSCKMCVYKERTPKAIMKHRKDLYDQVKSTIKGSSGRTDASELEGLLRQIEQAHLSGEPSTARFGLSYAYVSLATAFFLQGKNGEGIRTVVRCLEVRGFQVTASLPP